MKRILLLVFVLGIFSCSPEESPIISTEKIIIYSLDIDLISLDMHPYFLMLTNQRGENIFDTIDLRIEKKIEVEIQNGDIIDVTFGIENATSFNIYTLTEIVNGATISLNSSHLIEQSCVNIPRLSAPAIKLTITDVNEIEEIYSPFYNSQSVYAINSLELTGITYPELENLLTLREKGSDTFKSYVLNYEEWEQESEDTLVMEISYNDFQQPIIYDINLEISNEWKLKSRACTSDNNVIQLQNFNNQEVQNTNQVKLFIPQHIEIEEINLNLSNLNGFDLYFHSDLHNDIPETISIFNPEVSYSSISEKFVEFKTNEDYDLNKCTFEYWNENFRGSWEIISKPKTFNTIHLPKLPEEYLNTTVITNDLIRNPTRITNAAVLFPKDEPSTIDYQSIIRSNLLNKLQFDLRNELVHSF